MQDANEHLYFFRKIKKGKELRKLDMEADTINRSFVLEKPIMLPEEETTESGLPGSHIKKTNRKKIPSISEITLLNAAIYYGNVAAIKKLLEKGANPKKTTTLHIHKQHELVGKDLFPHERGWRNSGSSTKFLDAEEFFEKFMKDECEADEGAEILKLIKERAATFRATEERVLVTSGAPSIKK